MTGRCERNALATKLAEAQQITDRLTESECDKIMAMTDDQIAAALRLEGRDPKDVATISRQAMEIATLRVELTAALAHAKSGDVAERVREACAKVCDAVWENEPRASQDFMFKQGFEAAAEICERYILALDLSQIAAPQVGSVPTHETVPHATEPAGAAPDAGVEEPTTPPDGWPMNPYLRQWRMYAYTLRARLDATQRDLDAALADTNRLRFLSDLPVFDAYGAVDINEEASICASALGRDEPNSDDYLAAFRTAIDAAIIAKAREGK